MVKGELILPLTSYSTWQSRLHSSSRQYSKAGSAGMGMDESARVQDRGELTPPLVVLGDLARGSARELPLVVRVQNCWCTDQLS